MPATRGYTHVVETSGRSRTIYLAGQLGMTPDGKFAGGPGDFRAQAAQAFENLKHGLSTCTLPVGSIRGSHSSAAIPMCKLSSITLASFSRTSRRCRRSHGRNCRKC